VVDPNACTECGICVKVCPGRDVDFPGIQNSMFGGQPADPYLGNFIRVLAGYTTIPRIRRNGASGGVVTGILVDLLRRGEIQGALVVRMSTERPLEPHVFLAKSEAEIISSQQSKYLPVPMNVGLKSILEEKDGQYAVVGLPCHFQNLFKAERRFLALRKRIRLRLGLFCGYNPTLSSTKFLIRRAGIKDFSMVREIRYREGEWPGGFRVLMKDGKDHFLFPRSEYMSAHWVFERHRCAMCNDQMCEFADLSFGDELKPVPRQDGNGWSYIITRTRTGDDVVTRLVRDGILYVEKTTAEEIARANFATLLLKKKGNRAFFRIRKMFGKKFPNYHLGMNPVLRMRHYIGSLLIFLVSFLFDRDWFNRLFVRFPSRLFWRYVHLLIKLMEK
jgi:coenzyme F420 hydrogenase subunit beta